jgi:putative transposase
VINTTVTELRVHTSEREACKLTGTSRATRQRQSKPLRCGPPKPRRRPVNELTPAEQAEVLKVLRSEEFCDSSPTQTWAKLLDRGIYLCSVSTMYRLLRTAGECRERRRQSTHPARKKPELLATKPCQVWSWDITKLRGPERGVYYDLYVIIDIYSRYVVGWTVQNTETGELAKQFIDDTLKQHKILPGTLTLHADRGTSMTSKPVSQLLTDLGIHQSHSRPSVSNDNPYSEAAFKTLKYCPAFPPRFGSLQDARNFCKQFFEFYNYEHYHSGIGLLTPATVHHGNATQIICARTNTLAVAYEANPNRFCTKPLPPRLPEKAWINDPSKEALIKHN